MAHQSDIREHMRIVGADGVHVGTVDKVEGNRLKLTKADSGQGSHAGHHHYLPLGLVANVEGNQVHLSATGANAFLLREEKDEGSDRLVTSERQSRRSSSDNGKRSGSTFKWVAPALGVATLAAGAALLARGKSGKSGKKKDVKRFEVQLESDENIRLISSTKVEGTAVIGRNGERLGKVESFMVDKYSGRVAYAILSFGGTLGFGGSLFPLPWSLLDYDVAKDGYFLDITSQELAAAPRFKPSEAPEFDSGYRRNVHRAYDRRAL